MKMYILILAVVAGLLIVRRYGQGGGAHATERDTQH